jgi:hypothetical protein
MDSTPNSSWLAHVDLWVALEWPTMKLDSFTAIISALTEAQVRFKAAAGRPQDLIDIEHLRMRSTNERI